MATTPRIPAADTSSLVSLQAGEALLDAALEASDMGAWKYTFGDEICYLSPRAQELYGVPHSHFVRDAAAVREMLHPDDLASVQAATRLACEPTGDGRYRSEYRVRQREGGWRWLSVWGIVEFDASRAPIAMTGASRDITADKQAAIFSEAQKRSLELIVGGAPLSDVLTYLADIVERQSDGEVVVGILLLDGEGRLRNGASPSLPDEYVAAIDGLVADADVGTCSAAAATCRTVITPDIGSDPGWQALKHLPLGLGLCAAWSQPITASDGRVLGTFGTYFRSCRVPSQMERHAVEVLSRTAALAIDRARIDEALRTSEQRLRDDDRRKNEFLASLSHELRNPLAPLRTGLHLLQQDLEKPHRHRLVETLDRQVSQLVRLVDDLLEVSRISRGALELRRDVVSVSSIVQLAIETSEPGITAASHELIVMLPEHELWVDGDRVRLAQVLSNLLNNAARYTDRGGRIEVTAEVVDGNACIAVKDNGAGIEPDLLPQLFELFARGSQAHRHREGLGVGLALARRLAEMHGGTLTGVSDGLGRGTTFTICLPLASRPQAMTTTSTSMTATADTPAPLRVLVVDDNVDAAEMTMQLLAASGCDVRSAHDGRSALQEATDHRPKLVLLDIGLPDQSGHAVCRQMRTEPWGHDATIVAVTGWGQERDRLDSETAGFDAHFVKPVDIDSLLQLVEKVRQD